MGDAAEALAGLLAEELLAPPPSGARRLAEAMRSRCGGDRVAAILFYGSCLRRETSEGVLDFYVLVDAYRSAYRSTLLAGANALLPPNVFYLELESPQATLRAKYALMSTRDFERAAAGHGLRSSVWARFCQPARAVYVRDELAQQLVVRCAAESVLTALRRILPLLDDEGRPRRLPLADFWQRAFRETYAAEMRTESAETVRSLYDAAPERFDRAARRGLAALEERGALHWRGDGGEVEVELRQGAGRGQRVWGLRRRLAKAAYLVWQLKTALTFGDWLPYALWKLERHTGTRLVPSERQRRHPFLCGWPLLLRVLWRRELR